MLPEEWHRESGIRSGRAARLWTGWAFGIVAAAVVVLLVIVAFDFARNVYIDGEALFGRILIGFLASVAVFLGLLAAALVRSGRSGSPIGRVFTAGLFLALLGAIAGLMVPASATIGAVGVGTVGLLLMAHGAVRG
jgi:hypothetical protein